MMGLKRVDVPTADGMWQYFLSVYKEPIDLKDQRLFRAFFLAGAISTMRELDRLIKEFDMPSDVILGLFEIWIEEINADADAGLAISKASKVKEGREE